MEGTSFDLGTPNTSLDSLKSDGALFDSDIESDLIQRNTDFDTLKALDFQRKKGFWSRNFGLITPGGVRSSVFTLFSGTVGAGVLSLPHVLKNFFYLYYDKIPNYLFPNI